MISEALYRRYYPDDTRNATKAFYSWLRSGLRPRDKVLNVGAGPETKSPIRILKGEVRQVIGVDIDPVVLTNSELDETHITEGDRLPFEDRSFDAAYADYVLEHVENPRAFLSEIYRVLRPGGCFWFRTPNRRHYVATISRLTPHGFHRLVANRVRGLPADAHEPWKTYYRLNTEASIREYASEAGFRNVELRFFEPNPSYLVFNRLAFLVGVAVERCLNRYDGLAAFKANILGKICK